MQALNMECGESDIRIYRHEYIYYKARDNK